jgi:Cu/Zn superoxide dismutase
MNPMLLTAGLALALGAQGGGAPIHVLPLRPMPEGDVALTRSHVTISELGLTPGSTHRVELRAPGLGVTLGTLTADATGRADASLTSPRNLPWGSRVVVDLGSAGDAQSRQPIARTRPLSRDSRPIQPLVAVGDVGTLAGTARTRYDAGAQTLTVQVTAFGLEPGRHAAHIHIGSCETQGAVKYMLPDLVADAGGAVLHQVRVIHGVTSNPGTGLYLNIHEGDSDSILANGMPTLAFRPLLCANF